MFISHKLLILISSENKIIIYCISNFKIYSIDYVIKYYLIYFEDLRFDQAINYVIKYYLILFNFIEYF